MCLTCESPTVTDINLAYGDGSALLWLMAHIEAFQEKLNVPNKMNVYEIETCAQNIFDSFHHLKCTELMLFFARLLGGMYPVEWHGYVTPTKIMTALRDHFMPWRNNLLSKIEHQRLKQQREAYRNDPDRMTYDEWQEIKTIESMYNPPAPPSCMSQ